MAMFVRSTNVHTPSGHVYRRLILEAARFTPGAVWLWQPVFWMLTTQKVEGLW